MTGHGWQHRASIPGAAASRGALSPCAVRVGLRGDGLAPCTCVVSLSQLLSAHWRQHPVAPSVAPQAITGSLGKEGDLEGKLEGETHCGGPGVQPEGSARAEWCPGLEAPSHPVLAPPALQAVLGLGLGCQS